MTTLALTINGRDQTIYFARPTQRMMIQQPFDVAEVLEASGDEQLRVLHEPEVAGTQERNVWRRCQPGREGKP